MFQKSFFYINYEFVIFTKFYLGIGHRSLGLCDVRSPEEVGVEAEVEQHVENVEGEPGQHEHHHHPHQQRHRPRLLGTTAHRVKSIEGHNEISL